MMQLSALEPEERAYLQSLASNPALRALAARLRQRLVATLGVAAEVDELPGSAGTSFTSGSEPAIGIAPALAAAWLAVRLGGRPGMLVLQVKDDALVEPLRHLVRRALAETVINLGDTAWPQAVRLQVAIGPQRGEVEIFWNGGHAMAWARRVIREKA